MRIQPTLDLLEKAFAMNPQVVEAGRIIKIQEQIIEEAEALRKEACSKCPHVYILRCRVESDLMETHGIYSWECLICGDCAYETGTLPLHVRLQFILVTKKEWDWILKNKVRVIEAIRRKRKWTSIVKTVKKLLKSSKVSK